MNTRNCNLLIVLFFVGAFTAPLLAQDEGGTSFGLRAGVNFQNINGKDDFGDKLENNLVTGFHVGAQMEIPIAPDFYFQPGLVFTTKGTKGETNILETTVNQTINLSYIELPLHLVYKPMLGTGHLILGLGPYLSYAIGGKAKYDGSGLSTENDIVFQNEVNLTDLSTSTYFKRMDVGADLLVGYQFSSGLFFQLNAQLGLIPINPNYTYLPDDKSNKQNTGFGLSVGYMF